MTDRAFLWIVLGIQAGTLAYVLAPCWRALRAVAAVVGG